MFVYIEEKKAWVRPQTHTLVPDRDPDFARLVGEAGGVVMRWLRVWVAEPGAPAPALKSYLGCVGLCPGLPPRDELVPIFRRVSDQAAAAGLPGRRLRQELARQIRLRLDLAAAPGVEIPRPSPAGPARFEARLVNAGARRQPFGGLRGLLRRLGRGRRVAAACVAAALLIAFGVGCQQPVKELRFEHVPPLAPRPPTLVAPDYDRACRTVRSTVEIQDWWREGWNPAPKAQVAIVTTAESAEGSLAATAATRLGLLLQQSDFRLVDLELEERLGVRRNAAARGDVWVMVAVSVNAVERQQVTLASLYDSEDRRRYESDYAGFQADALRYLDRIDHEYIVRLKDVIDTDSPVYRAQIQRLMNDLAIVRHDLQDSGEAQPPKSDAAPRSTQRLPQITLPLEPYAAIESRRSDAPSGAAMPTASAVRKSGRIPAFNYDPLLEYDAADLPVPPAALDRKIAERQEYTTASFSVQVSQAEMAVRVFDGTSGQVVGLGVFRCTDNTVGRAVERMARAFSERFGQR